jgi:RecB family endonuclease NucS
VTLIEGWAKAIGAGDRVIIHREDGSFDFLKGERAVRVAAWEELIVVEAIRSGRLRSQAA